MTGYSQKTHKEPRLSVNKLGEYLATNKAARRERILKDAKIPPTYQVIRYDEAKRIIQQSLASGKINTQEIQNKISVLSAREAQSEFDERMIKSNVEALEYFIELVPSVAFDDFTLTLGEHAPPHLKLGDLSVSVRPDLIVRTKSKSGVVVGGLKLNIGKSAIHNKESGEYVGAIMIEHMKETHSKETVDFRCCMVLDVFGKKIIPAPKATALRIKDAMAAAVEIARVWPEISEP